MQRPADCRTREAALTAELAEAKRELEQYRQLHQKATRGRRLRAATDNKTLVCIGTGNLWRKGYQTVIARLALSTPMRRWQARVDSKL